MESLRQACGGVLSTTCAFVLLGALAWSGAAEGQIPVQAWVHDPVISSVNLSPDGRFIAAVSPPEVNAIPQITVWSAEDLGQPPARFDLKESSGARWKPSSVFWLKNRFLYIVGAQNFDLAIGARTTKTFRSKFFIAEVKSLEELRKDGKPFRETGFQSDSGTLRDLIQNVRLVNPLVLDDNKVLLGASNFEGAEDIYELDLRTFRTKRVFRGAAGSQAFTDLNGEVRGRTSFKGAAETARLDLELRKPGSSGWYLASSFYARDRQGVQPLDFSKDPNLLYMSDNKGREFAVIREYNLSTKQLSEPIFAHAKYDASGVVLGSTRKKYGELLGFQYEGPSRQIYWTDADRVALESALKKSFPGTRVSFLDFSDDETRAIIFVSSSNDIGTYYLYDAKKGLLLLGRVRPGLDPTQIATTELVSYKARDGLTIPAYLTIPKRGTKPFPLVVMPHGGPWARDDLDFDTWRQFLADRGYVVLQPQYRGSEGWGQTLWRAGDREWGQKMQDDKDDGARWLVTQGLVDPNRMAIYGFSYGGYAAMASIVRPNPPWQCAIAGAGLAELRTFDKITFEGRFGREFQNPTIAGLSPIDHVEQASIPIMIFHGNRDQIVPIEQSERYFAALKRAGKNVQYTEILDYGHGPSLSTAQQAQVLQILENYFAKDCGPGGL